MRLRARAVTLVLPFLIAAVAPTQAAPPVVQSIEPATSQLPGGVLLTIHGSNFGTGAVALVGGQTVKPLIQDDSTLVLNAPPVDAATQLPVQVQNTDGTSSDLPLDYAGPRISSTSSSSSAGKGGLRLTIAGSDFGLAPSVLFGDAEAPVQSSASTRIVCTVPPGSPGTSPGVRVLDGETSSSVQAFSYDAGASVTAVTPTAGKQKGGTLITIVGRDFGLSATVFMGGASAPVVSQTDTRIVCRSPASAAAGSVQVTVTGSDGTPSQPADFIYLAPPVISSISPTGGPAAGGTIVTVQGANFGPNDRDLKRNAAADTSKVGPVRWMAPESLRLTMPPSPDPTQQTQVAITVSIDGETSTGSIIFTYDPSPPAVPAPAITAVTTGAQVRGGMLITLTGSNFKPTAGSSPDVFVGDDTVSPTLATNTSITCVLPERGAGTATQVGVEVDGQASPPVPVQYDAPAIALTNPSSSSCSGGTAITISGFFPDLPQVLVGGDALEPMSATTREILLSSPPSPVDTRSLQVVGGGSASNSAVLDYPGPDFIDVTPTQGTARGGIPITLKGTDFGGSMRVWAGENEAPILSRTPDTTVCLLPAARGGGGGGAIHLQGLAAGAVRTNELAFSYLPVPVISTTDPIAGRKSGGTRLTISGQNFGSSVAVSVGGSNAGVVSFTATAIVCDTPAGAAGPADLVVTSDGVASDPASFDYLDPPVVTSINPDTGPLEGGTYITIVGSNFGPSSGSPPRSVRFGDQDAGVQSWSPVQALCVLPASPAGGAADVVLTVDGVADTAAGGFTYSSSTGIGDAGLPMRFRLAQNRPNPFAGSTRIEFALPEASAYELSVYDLSGRLVWRDVGRAGPGTTALTWDGRTAQGEAAAPGVYFYRLRPGSHERTLRMLRLR
jgi:hypothetical protein